MSRYFLSVLVLAVGAPSLQAGSQLFPAARNSGKLSAYLIKPTEGVDKLPAGWALATSLSYGTCALANEAAYIQRGAKAGVLETRSYALPKANYTVSLCVRGKGKARLKGAEQWVEINAEPANRYQWVKLGEVTGAVAVAVEVAPDGGTLFYYGGVLAEGDKMPINPVAKVRQRIRSGGPVTVVLLGDSVTENSGGTGGGSSSFAKGNPGLMKAYLEKASGRPVDYLAHREPKHWPKIGSTRSRIRNEDPAAWPELDKIPTATIGGKKYIDARQTLDAARKVHLVNLGKGGADATYAWTRMPETIFEYDYRFNGKAMAAKGLAAETVRHGLGHYKPDLVIINFGTNDNNGAHLKWTLDDCLFFTRCAATNIQQRFGAAVILATPHKWNDGVHLSHHWQPLLVDRLRDYCRRSGFALADIYVEYKLGENDGIHPRDGGHGHMAAAYVKAIEGRKPLPASAPTVTDADLKANGDGTVTCAKAGLMMLADPNALGTVTSHKQAAGLIEKMNADKELGHSDWRLARKSELFGMIDQSRRPAVVAGAPFKNLSGYYFTDGEGKTWGVDLTVGIAHTLGRRGSAKTGHVFPVREAKQEDR